MTVSDDRESAGAGPVFRVRPGALDEFADSIRAQGRLLAENGGALGATVVERGWFGKLPESGHLADGYDGHREAELAALADLVRELAATAAALDATAERYGRVDAAAAEALHAVGAAMGR